MGDENGCNKPDLCVPQERDYEGNLCPVHCPGICGENEILCEGHKEAMGCKMPAICNPKGMKTKDVNGIYCQDDSASHDCPVECDETIGEVLCHSYDSPIGCKPRALCIPRPQDVNGDYCPAHSACAKECTWDEILCPDGADSRGCKNADLCLPRGEDRDGNLCPGSCPAICSDNEFNCPGPIFNNGCRGPGLCIEKTLDVNGIECPEICPVFCNENEHMHHEGVDSRGCLMQDTCHAKCTGGDSCCHEEHKCGVGEGDCDSDADCEEGLLCGTGNCPSTRSAFWDADDDCCYKPENPPSCIETGYHWIGGSDLIEKFDTDSARRCAQRRIDVIGLHGEMLQTLKAAGYCHKKETPKMLTMVETKEQQGQNLVLFWDVLLREVPEMARPKAHVIVSFSATQMELASLKNQQD